MLKGERKLRESERRRHQGGQHESARVDQRRAARYFFRRHTFRYHCDIAAAQGARFTHPSCSVERYTVTPVLYSKCCYSSYICPQDLSD